MDAVESCQDLVVPKPQNSFTLVLHELRSLGFAARGAIVLSAVDFDDQPGLVADKIGSVGADRDLAAELAFEYAPSTGCFSFLGLRGGRHHPHPNPPPSRGRAVRRASCSRRRNERGAQL